MRVSDFDDFETEGLLTGSKERNWLWLGLAVSLAIHFALCVYFYRTRFQSPEALFAQSDQTPTFKVKRIVESNLEKSSVDQTNPAAKPNPDNTTAQLPDEKKSFDRLLEEIQSTVALPDDTRDVLPEKPKVEQPDVTSMLTEIERSTAQTLSARTITAQRRCDIGPSTAGAQRDRAGYQHNHQAPQHLYQQTAGRQRRTKQGTYRGF
jgi:hypothetical protein